VAIAEYDQLDGLGLAAAVQRGDVSAAELLEEAIARAERLNPRLGAIVGTTYDEARRQAAAPPAGDPNLRPFEGVPFLLKDLYAEMAGVPATGSSRYLADYRPAHDATIVTRFRRAGLVIFGKTNTPELGLVPATEPKLYGPARNPWNPQLSCGGSSGGSAAAVAAGIVPLAHANDGGGSIRIPASCCGLFGLKPTRGRTPVGPDRTEIWNGYTIGHVISRSVRDSAAALDAIAGPESNSPYWAPPPARPFLAELGTPPGRLRVALTKRPQAALATPHADCLAAADDAGRLLADLGHAVEEADLEIDAEAFARDFFTLVCVEMAAFLARAAPLVGRRAAISRPAPPSPRSWDDSGPRSRRRPRAIASTPSRGAPPRSSSATICCCLRRWGRRRRRSARSRRGAPRPSGRSCSPGCTWACSCACRGWWRPPCAGCFPSSRFRRWPT
jgi:amidase